MTPTHYVVGFVFDPQRQKVVLIEKNHPAWQKGLWNGLEGKKNPEESWEAAVSRECQEESGLHVPAEDWEHTLTLYNDNFECRFFRTFAPTDGAQTLTDEKVEALPLVDVLGGSYLLINNLRWIIPLQLDRGVQFPLAPIFDRP